MMRVDALAVASPNLFKAGLAVDELVATSLDRGLDMVVVAPGRPFDYALEPANDQLAAACTELQHVARLGRVDPLQGAKAVAEARRCLRELHCVGLFLQPGEECFRLPEAVKVVKVAAAAGAPVVIAAGLYGQSEPLQLLSLSRAVPDAIIIMTSGGQINISGLSMIDAWAALTRSPNLYVMTNGEYRQDYIERIARDLGPERMLFASYAPYYDQGYELARIANADLDAEARQQVEGGNAQRLFGL